MEPVSLRKQKLDDDRIPFIPDEAPIAETSHSFDARARARDDIIPNEESLEPLIPELRRLASKSQVNSRKAPPSRLRRTLRATRRFCLAILIGVGITLVWQSYGEEAKALIANRVPALAVLFPGSKDVAATSGDATKDTASSQAAARSELASSLSAAALNTVMQNLTAIQSTLEQIAAKQEATIQSITALQKAENEIGHRPSAQATAPVPPKKKAPVAAAAHASQGQPSTPAAGTPAPRAPLSLTR